MRIGILEDRHSSLGGSTRNGDIHPLPRGQMLSLHKPQKREQLLTLADSTDDTSVGPSCSLLACM